MHGVGEEGVQNRGRSRDDKIYCQLAACRNTKGEQGDIDAIINAEADYFIYVPN